eukprot:10313718-Ditylum_brightwellii.AAC.1
MMNAIVWNIHWMIPLNVAVVAVADVVMMIDENKLDVEMMMVNLCSKIDWMLVELYLCSKMDWSYYAKEEGVVVMVVMDEKMIADAGAADLYVV